MSTEVDITKLINFGNLSFYDGKIKSYIATELDKKSDDTNTTYQLVVVDNKLQLQKKEINAADWENVGDPLSLGGDYSLELKEDGKLYLINEVTSEESVVELPGNISQGEAEGTLTSGVNAQAISQGSTAIGIDVTAGSKAFYIEAINHVPATADSLATGTIYLRTTDTLPDDGSSRRAILGEGTFYEDFTMTDGYAVGDEFSIIRSVTDIADHFAFCGTITAIQGNMISYECYIMGGGLVRDENGNWTPGTECVTATDWATRAGSEDRAEWADSIFWVPTKPEVGFVIWNHDDENPMEVFEGVTTFGYGNYGSADSVFIAGESNVAGGDGATIFGTRNRGAYGNLISGGDNVSNGLHSAILGRYNINLGDYNFILNTFNIVKAGSNYNLVGGYNDTIIGDHNAAFGKTAIIEGNYNIFSGEGALTLIGNNNSAFGKTLSVKGNYNIATGIGQKIEGTGNAAFGNSAQITGNYNIIAGEYDTNQVIKGSYNAGFGRKNTIYGSYHLVSGMGNKVKLPDGVTDQSAIYYNCLLGQSLISSGRNNSLIGTRCTSEYKYSTAIGTDLAIKSDFQVVLGYNTKDPDPTDAFVVGFNGPKLTVPQTGVPSKSSDAITYGYLQEALLNGEW